MVVTALPQRPLRMGLKALTPLPLAAGQVGLLAVLVRRFGCVEWSADLATVERLLAYLTADSGSAEPQRRNDDHA